MSTDALQQLIGLSVIRAEKVHDYLQLEFSNGTILSIFNNHQYGMGSLSSIQGKQLLTVDELEDRISFKFQKGDLSVVWVTQIKTGQKRWFSNGKVSHLLYGISY